MSGSPGQTPGLPVAVIPRGSYGELRVEKQEFRTWTFFTLRVWQASADGDGWKPVPGYINVRLHEIQPIIAALQAAAESVKPAREIRRYA